MAIDPKLVSIKEAKYLPTSEAKSTSDFLFFEDQVLKKSPMSNIYDKVTSGIKGNATQANAPTPYTAEDFPNGLFETYVVRTPLTMPNSWGSAVTQAELDANFVYFDVDNGVVSKFYTLKPKLEPFSNEGIQQITDWNYPFVEVPTTEIRQNIALAIKEIYIKNADFLLYDYLITDFRRSQDLGSGYPDNRYEINIAVVNKGTTTLVSEFNKVVNSHIEPIGLDLWNLGDFYILIDWYKFPNKTGFSVVRSLTNRLNERCSDLKSNSLIQQKLNFGNQVNNKEHFLPSAYVTDSYKELNGAFLSIDVAGDIRKYGQLYLNHFENNSGDLKIYIKNTAGNIVMLNSPTSAFTDIQQITLYDIYDGTFLYPLIKMTIDGSKLHDGYFDYGTDLPLNLQPIRFKDVSEYFKLYKKNLGKLAYLNSGVQVLGLSTRNYTVKNAEDVGILPTNTASQNSTAINAAISGGNVLLKINKAGVYLLGNSIEIESNTSIFNTEGVIYKKTIEDYAFVNKGARNRTINSNIHFHNLEIDSDAKTSFISGINNVNLCTYGLRGSVSFFGVNTVRMTGYFRIHNEHDVACQLANWHDVAMENVYIESLSDAVHINDGSKFRGKNFNIRSDDDAIPLNAMDWINSSPSFGDISDIVVENFQDADSGLSGLGGQTMRNLVGAWIDYYPGVSVMIGDVVTHNGINYRVLANIGTSEAVSTVEPTITTDGVQADGNFFWKYAGISDGKYQANVYDVLINGLKSYTEDRHICRFDAERYAGTEYGRAIHPDVLPANLPFVKNVNFMNVWKDTYGHFIYAGSDMTGIKYEYRITGAKGFKQKYFDNPYQSDGSVIELYDCDMTGNNEFLATGINTTAVVLNALNGFGYLRGIDIGGKLITDANVEDLPTAKVEDSICYFNDEMYVVYRGNWQKV